MDGDKLTSKTDSEELKTTLQSCIDSLTAEANELYLDQTVAVLDSPLTPLQFYRDFISPNKPVVIRDLINHWSALRKWGPSYFRETIGNLQVTATVTPNGYADAIHDGKFVMPEERLMSMSRFLDILDSPGKEVFYIQKQNSNLTDEFTEILKDVDCNLKIGEEAFGKQPDAVNFWMGDGRAVTSMHRDHYENMYCVISGWKKFILIPPTDLPYIPYEDYPTGIFKQEDGIWSVVDDPNTTQVPWIAIDPLHPDTVSYPQYNKATPREVTVRAGETLYLPSLWFHHVQQSHGCIAVNYWYDMEYDIKYNYYKFLEKLTSVIK
ncbi:bifunctional peptidase and (3S)-lysyl hydroxylase Jmjd7 [Patella vulgata]|uniref:bifunctional peptidase and (3S)-lysyl hydroxylase Jmjd7 n=1 Tax=Patella vulgata TaxID=6465 RepID=UPI00218076E6|nr:bifunctional peptidase and (3S)-lysyl hydroxylase Jmjd7 [Patella vulgata]